MAMLESEERYLALQAKFSHIHPIEREDLNIQNNIDAILVKVWTNIGKYPTFRHIFNATGIYEKKAGRMAVRLRLPKRY